MLTVTLADMYKEHAPKKFFRKLLKGLRYVPRVIITDKLKSYGAAKRDAWRLLNMRIGAKNDALIDAMRHVPRAPDFIELPPSSKATPAKPSI